MSNTTTTTATGAGNSAAQYVTLGKGCGYWDVSKYPRGGCFRRAGQDGLTAQVIDGPAIFGGSDIREYHVKLPNGGTALFPCSGVHTVKVSI